MRLLSKFLILLLSVFVFAFTSFAQNANEADIEQKAKNVGKQLRCVVCQNQSIEDSPSDLASDMRKLVRKRLAAGDSESEVINYIRDRYGDYVLLNPPVQKNTYILWLSPFIALVFVFVFFWRRSKAKADLPDDLSEEEKAKLRAISKQLQKGGGI